MRSVDFTIFTALDAFLILGVSSMSLLVVRAMSRHEKSVKLSIWNRTNGYIMFYDHTMDGALNMGILMMGCPIILLFETVEFRGGE